MNDVQNTPIIVGISGSSGVAIAEKTINRLLQEDVPVITVCSNYAKLVWHQELGKSFKDSLSIWSEHPKFQYFRSGDMTANIASGSTPIRSMIVAPCSMSTLASIANGISSNLLHRAADVTIKENRNLIIVPRETPLSSIHLERLFSESLSNFTNSAFPFSLDVSKEAVLILKTFILSFDLMVWIALPA